ncbi:MAG: bifunctional demethylmenaquinone methyltransferase/2-methoxy-6-polyprenyl-1,4-benzoquinol methylase UbiE [Solirubrobacterales bacterium]
MNGGETTAASEQQVRTMFDRIAGHYDLMNSVMSAGLHHRWRTRAADLAALRPGQRAVDLCAGTGDLAIELKRRVGAEGEVIGIDFSEPMLELARHKAEAAGLPVSFVHGNALELPFKDGYFDAATVGFGVRNLADLDRGIAEMARVVRPGGRVAVLEITSPKRPPLSWFYSLWFEQVVPLLGTAAGDHDAYSYLPESVRRFPEAQELAARMDAVGLDAIRYLLLAGGIVAIHSGVVREG